MSTVIVTALRAVLRFVSSVMLVSGVLLLADAGLTLAWQEPVSALMAARDQKQLDRQLDAEFATVRSDTRTLDLPRGSARALRFLADRYERRLRNGRAVGRISLPTLGREYTIVQGTDRETLRKGPAHYPETPLPGQGATIAVAGHRTTYLAPFRTIDDLRRGDRVVVTMPYGRFTYRVRRTQIVRPDASWVKRPAGYEQIVLTACHPLYSAARRIVVFARLVNAEALDARTSARSGGDNPPVRTV